MKKILGLLAVFTIILTGCINPNFLDNPEKYAQENYERLDEQFKFNWEDFPYGLIGCWNQLLCTTPGMMGFDYDYEPADGFEHIAIQMSGYGFTPMSIADTYLADYFANEYIIDEDLGNNIDDFFLKLEDEGIKYYISKVQGINTKEAKDFMKVVPTTVCVIDMEQFEMEDDIINYLNGKDSSTIPWVQFIKDYECSPNLQVYVNRDNLKEHNITIEQLRAESKKYYNPDTMEVTFEYPDFSEDAKIYNYYYADSTTESQPYSKDTMLGYEPQYDWKEN